jgi:hypothetical protein
MFCLVLCAPSVAHAATIVVHDSDVAAVVSTHAPVMRWTSTVRPAGDGAGGGVFAFRVNVSAAAANTLSDTPYHWSTGEVYQQPLGTWTGLAVYEGAALQAGHGYAWTAEERWVAFPNGSRPTAGWQQVGTGSFTTSPILPSVEEELRQVMDSPNMSRLWNGSWHSVADRVTSSGFLPTSVSGGYGGITQQFVRDGSGQLLGLLQLGSKFYPRVGSLVQPVTQPSSFHPPHNWCCASWCR